jgi:hypothetical protein
MDLASLQGIPMAEVEWRAREGGKRNAYVLALIHAEPGM